MPKFFDLSFKELLEAKHPTAWVEFERDLINEEQLFAKFFKDGRSFDGKALVQMMVSPPPGAALFASCCSRCWHHHVSLHRVHSQRARLPCLQPSLRCLSAGHAGLATHSLCCLTPKVDYYDYIEGMEPLLARLQAAGYPLHLMSNYPMWYRCAGGAAGPGHLLHATCCAGIACTQLQLPASCTCSWPAPCCS